MVELMVFLIQLPFVLLGAVLSVVFGLIGVVLSILGTIFGGLWTVFAFCVAFLLIVWVLSKVVQDAKPAASQQ